MTGDFIRFNESTLTFRSQEPKEVGDVVHYDLCMPEGILLRSLTFSGIVNKCRYMHGNGGAGYILEMTVDNLSDENRLILDAYMEFLKREEEISNNTFDQEALQETFKMVGEKIAELYKESVLLLRNLKDRNILN